jgi:hypothetical protein
MLRTTVEWGPQADRQLVRARAMGRGSEVQLHVGRLASRAAVGVAEEDVVDLFYLRVWRSGSRRSRPFER